MVLRWHPDVDDDDVGLAGANELEQLARIAGLADDLEPGPLEQTREALAQEKIVVRERDAKHAVPHWSRLS